MSAAHSRWLPGAQHQFVKPHRVEPRLLPGEEVVAGIPHVAFSQQLVEGPHLPETKSRKFAVSKRGVGVGGGSRPQLCGT
jgi:hypothetical protein